MKKTIIIPILLLCFSVFSQEKAYNFSYPDTSGKLHNLSQYDGKVRILFLWASWCHPCHELFSSWYEVQTTYRGDTNVVFISIAVSEKNDSAWRETIRKGALSGITLFADDTKWIQDIDCATVRTEISPFYISYWASVVPKFVIVDKHGIMLFNDWRWPSDVEFEDELDKLLKL